MDIHPRFYKIRFDPLIWYVWLETAVSCIRVLYANCVHEMHVAFEALN